MTTPLETFIGIWHEKIPAAVLPYVETVNLGVNTNDLPETWAASIYLSVSRDDVTLGSRPWVEETGTIGIGLFTRSGKGPAVLDQAADYIRQTFHGARRDGLLILKVDGPHDIDPQGFGEWFQVGMTAHFIFQTRRDASGPLYGDWQGFPEDPPPPLAGP